METKANHHYKTIIPRFDFLMRAATTNHTLSVNAQIFWTLTDKWTARNTQIVQNIASRLAPFNLPPSKVYQSGEIVCISSGDHKNMKQLMTMACKVKPPWHPPLRHPRRINDNTESIESSHNHLVPCRHHRLRPVTKSHQLMHDRHQPRQCHANKEPGTHWSVLRRLKDRKKRHDNGGDAEDSDSSEVYVTYKWVTCKRIVDKWIEWCDDETGDSGVV